MRTFLCFLVILVTSVEWSNAQDEHFSQFYAFPVQLNPSLAGAYNGTYRMTAINRDQWNNNLESPYRTFAAGGDTRFKMSFGNKRTKDHFGLGLFFVSDRVSLFQASTNQISTYFAYHKRLGDKIPSYLGVGVKMGIIQKNINYDNLTFQDQFNQLNGYDGQTIENLPPNNFGFFDMSVGLNYNINLEKTNYYLGVAAHHVTNPRTSFFFRLRNVNPSIDISQKLASRYVLHLSMDKQLNYKWSVQPRIVYQLQGEDNQLDLGTNIEYTFQSQRTGLIAGIWLTMIDDLDSLHPENITPLIGIRQGMFIFGFSYDVHLRDTFDSPFGFNTFEFSIRFTGEHSNDATFCPTF